MGKSPFFAVPSLAQEEREAWVQVWESPRTPPFSCPTPSLVAQERRGVPCPVGTFPVHPLRQRWGEPGLPNCPSSQTLPEGLGSLWGHGGVRQGDTGALGSSLRGPPTPSTPGAFCSQVHPVRTRPPPAPSGLSGTWWLPWRQPRLEPCVGGPPLGLATWPALRSPGHPLAKAEPPQPLAARGHSRSILGRGAALPAPTRSAVMVRVALLEKETVGEGPTPQRGRPM